MIEISWPLLITQVVTFLAAMVIVWKLFWKPLTTMMKDRSNKIADDIQRAERGRKEIESLEAEYRRRLTEIEDQARQQIAEAIQKGNLAKEEILKEARLESQKILEKAERDLQAERNQVIRALRSEVTEMTLAAVERILGQGIDQKIQKRLMDEFLNEIDQVKKVS